MHLPNPNNKITIEIIFLLLFLMFGTAGAMKAQDFTVTVTASPVVGGTVTGAGSYSSGASCAPTATPNTGWVFYQWSDGETTATHSTFSITSDVDLTAYFAPTSIGSATDWGYFCDAIYNEFTYNGLTVTLTSNIIINRTAGDTLSMTHSTPQGTSTKVFQGTFDGNGHTMTLSGGDFGTPGAYLPSRYSAPFCYVDNAIIKNLIVDGDIYTKEKFAGGFIASATGVDTVYNCVSAVRIHSTYGDTSSGGFLSIISATHDNYITFEGCVFVGQLLGGAKPYNWGGFVGWRDYQDSKKTMPNSSIAFVPQQLLISNLLTTTAAPSVAQETINMATPTSTAIISPKSEALTEANKPTRYCLANISPWNAAAAHRQPTM